MTARFELEQVLEDFFENWARKYHVTATIEAGLRLREARDAYYQLITALISNETLPAEKIRLRRDNEMLRAEVTALRAEKARFKQAVAISQRMAEQRRRRIEVRCRKRLRPVVARLISVSREPL